MPQPTPLYYVNGLERTGVGKPEELLSRYFSWHNFSMTHAEIDWHSDQSHSQVFEKAYDTASQLLWMTGRLAIAGVSMGGPLVARLHKQLRADNPDATILTNIISGYLQTESPHEHLEYTALHRPGKKPSYSCIGTVLHCASEVVPNLRIEDKDTMATTVALGDSTVPPVISAIDGVRQYRVPMLGHPTGIAAGAIRLPRVIHDLELVALAN